MRSLFLQISVLIGVLTLSNRMAGDGALTEAGLSALGSATAMYIVLAVGDIVVQRVLEYFAPGAPMAEEPEKPVARTDAAEPSADSQTALAA